MRKLVLALTLALAQSDVRSAVRVLYVNGASASDASIPAQALTLVQSLVNNGVSADYTFAYFPIAQSELESAEALICQREFSRESFPTSGRRPAGSEYQQYFLNLGGRYESFGINVLLNPLSCIPGNGVPHMGAVTSALATEIAKQAAGNDTIVLVGYSQGNNYVEGAVALALARGDINSLDRVQIVGIGSPALSSPGGRYVNGSQDGVVYGSLLNSEESLPATFTFCIADCLRAATPAELVSVGASSNIHFLAPTYLNSKINSLERLEPIPKTIASEVTAAVGAPLMLQPGPEGFDTFYGTFYLPGSNGDAETLYDGGWGDYYYDFFRWDLSSLPPADSVSQVLLYLYFNATGNDPAFQVQRVTSAWDEATLTRTNYPTATGWGNWTGITTTGWHSLDITDLYKNWKNGTWPNYGIELAPTAIIQTNGSIISSDYLADPTLRPKLVITTLPDISEF